MSGYHGRTIFSVDFNKETHQIISAGADDTLRIFSQDKSRNNNNGNNNDPSFVLETELSSAHESDINCVRWNPKDPTLLASASDDGFVKIWQYK